MTFRPHNMTFRTSKATWGDLGSRVVGVEYSMSTASSVSLSVTIEDEHGGTFERMPGLWEDGLELMYGYTVGTVQAVESGGSADTSSVTLHAISQGVAELNGGGVDPSYSQTKNVPGWVDATVGNLRSNWVKVIDPNLSDKTVESTGDSGEGTDDKTTAWDMITETAKKCGAWTWFNDGVFFFGKPSWLVDTGSQSEWRVTWDSWERHTQALVKKPHRVLDFSKKLWEGREELTLVFQDPEEMITGDRLARNIRPGHRLTYTGKAAPADDLWIVTEVQLPFVNTDPVTVTCWRPIDPPEIVDANGASGGGSAGVPTGPIGAGGWDGEQLENAAEIVKEGQRRKLPNTALVLAVQCAMGESTLINVGHGDEGQGVTNPDGTPTSSVGLFQQQEWWGSRTDRMTPSKSAGLFYDALVKTDYEGANDAGSASRAINRVQGNQNPMHYAEFWEDAKLVVEACIRAGESSKGGGGDGKPPSGPLGDRMRRSIDNMTGRYIDVDGAFGAQCADVGMQYATDVFGIGMVSGNGTDYWRNAALMPHCDAVPVSQPPRYGDIVSWSGSYGAYTNGGYGHIAIYISGDPASGSCMFLSQNPGAARVMPLSTSGIQGWMRPKG
ncbi:CHAP domain-containing protein [Kocuria rhizophila]|uniref:CHAP domain-containing protein n=1 Tax=Kocuria rhizophila TaxID=72000 RepID=UPI0021A3A646|nr:CHAP domain-containing protein [Kocuria rhizophila]MCT1879858.1 CHAP domain-containing protein [Kocuria rhizophila]